MNKEKCYELCSYFKSLDYLHQKIKTLDGSWVIPCKKLILETENLIIKTSGVIDVVGRQAKFLDNDYFESEYIFTIIKQKQGEWLEVIYDDGDKGSYRLDEIILLD